MLSFRFFIVLFLGRKEGNPHNLQKIEKVKVRRQILFKRKRNRGNLLVSDPFCCCQSWKLGSSSSSSLSRNSWLSPDHETIPSLSGQQPSAGKTNGSNKTAKHEQLQQNTGKRTWNESERRWRRRRRKRWTRDTQRKRETCRAGKRGIVPSLLFSWTTSMISLSRRPNASGHLFTQRSRGTRRAE